MRSCWRCGYASYLHNIVKLLLHCYFVESFTEKSLVWRKNGAYQYQWNYQLVSAYRNSSHPRSQGLITRLNYSDSKNALVLAGKYLNLIGRRFLWIMQVLWKIFMFIIWLYLFTLLNKTIFRKIKWFSHSVFQIFNHRDKKSPENVINSQYQYLLHVLSKEHDKALGKRLKYN